ncbi:TPA: ester cyclase [Aeromonas salmonicida]|nr:ester cyclase [Aeromonas salmonicida]
MATHQAKQHATLLSNWWVSQIFQILMVMAHSSTGYPSSEAACYVAVKLVGVPDFIEEFLAQGEKVYVRWRQEGRHLGNILGYEPTGLTLSTVGSAVYRVSGKKIVEYWIQQENQGLHNQLELHLGQFS